MTMDEDRYAELSERLDQLDLQLAVIVGILADNQQALLDKMEESFADRLLTPIRTDANLMKAPMASEPAVYAFPASRGSRDYRRIAREIIHRTNGRDDPPRAVARHRVASVARCPCRVGRGVRGDQRTRPGGPSREIRS